MNNFALLIDYEFCSGCKSCELACKNEHGYAPEEWGIKVLEDGPREHKDGTWHWDYVPHLTNLCDGCEKRQSEGRLIACAQHCLANVIEWGTPEEMAAKMAAKGHKVMILMP